MKVRALLGQVLVPLGILVVILGLAVGIIAMSPLGSPFRGMFSVMRAHKSLKDRSDALELGALMAGALQNSSLVSKGLIPGDDPLMPARLRELEPFCLSLDEKSGVAMLEFGGGFYHYGYRIRRAGDGGYRMECYGENPEDIDDLGSFRYDQPPIAEN